MSLCVHGRRQLRSSPSTRPFGGVMHATRFNFPFGIPSRKSSDRVFDPLEAKDVVVLPVQAPGMEPVSVRNLDLSSRKITKDSMHRGHFDEQSMSSLLLTTAPREGGSCMESTLASWDRATFGTERKKSSSPFQCNNGVASERSIESATPNADCCRSPRRCPARAGWSVRQPHPSANSSWKT